MRAPHCKQYDIFQRSLNLRVGVGSISIFPVLFWFLISFPFPSIDTVLDVAAINTIRHHPGAWELSLSFQVRQCRSVVRCNEYTYYYRSHAVESPCLTLLADEVRLTNSCRPTMKCHALCVSAANQRFAAHLFPLLLYKHPDFIQCKCLLLSLPRYSYRINFSGIYGLPDQ